jgi:hypothetical protein
MFKMSKMLVALYLIVSTIGVVTAWWLSGYDCGVTGENHKMDLLRRSLRVLVTGLLVLFLFHFPAGIGGGYGAAPIIMIIPITIGLIWCGCVSEWWSHVFHNMLFAPSKGSYDPNKAARDFDNLAMLLRNGRREEALQLAEQLREAGDVNILALETMLTRAGIEWTTPKPGDPAFEAGRLHAQGDFAGTEKILVPLLEKNPTHVQALLLLMRLYAQDLKQPARATEIFARLERVPRIPQWQVDYARRSLHDWSRDKPVLPPPLPLPETVDELLAQGYSGTAIEKLEQKTREQPGDFDAWLKLAEAQGLHCRNITAAEKIVRKMEFNRAFTPDQVQTARAKLTEWRLAGKK